MHAETRSPTNSYDPPLAGSRAYSAAVVPH